MLMEVSECQSKSKIIARTEFGIFINRAISIHCPLLAALASLHDGGLKPERHGTLDAFVWSRRKRIPQRKVMGTVTLHFRRCLIDSAPSVSRSLTFTLS